MGLLFWIMRSLNTIFWRHQNFITTSHLPVLELFLKFQVITKFTKIWPIFALKANVRKKVLFSRTDFLPWEILLRKGLDLEMYIAINISHPDSKGVTTNKFLPNNFFINKISQGRKSVREKSTFSRTFAFRSGY